MVPLRAYIQVFVFLLLSTTCLAFGSVTKLDESQRWRQSVAVRLTTRGPDRPYDVLRTRRDSSVTVTFNRAISTVLNATKRCTPSDEKRCVLAHNSPGLVGQVHYTFADEARKIRGHSTQVLMACRCLDTGCREAIVLEPRQIVLKNGTRKNVCLYSRVEGKWKDCHTELLRLKEIDVSDFQGVPDPDKFAVELSENNFWGAKGRRRYIRDISQTERNKLENMSFERILADFEDNARNLSNFYVFGNDTVGDSQFPDELVVESEDEDECAKLFDYAQRSADWMGAQQDQLAIGRNEDSFLVARPEEPSLSEAFLAIGTGLTGLFASIGIWHT
ncbi:hypothetical protein FGB62_107g110 [Gracilaria domingensis]|nr:hypothetical protein FGB62_107g110 [Gracilaria domingensis]